MGQCSVSNKKKPQVRQSAPEPRRPLGLNGDDKLHFSATYHITGSWGSLPFQTDSKTGTDFKYILERNFTIDSSVNSLQSQVFKVNLFAQETEKPISTVSISLWDVTTGPAFQSFPFLSGKRKVLGRFGAEIRVLQMTVLRIQALRVTCVLSPEQFGNFSLTLKCAAETDQETVHSDPSESADWDFNNLPLEKRLDFELPATVNTIRTAALQFRIWKNHPKAEEKSLVAESWLGFEKMMKEERAEFTNRERSSSGKFSLEGNRPNSAGKVTAQGVKVEKQFQGTLWLMGRQVGTVSGLLRIAGIPFISQIPEGVNTEEGFTMQNTEFIVRNPGKIKAYRRLSIPPQLQEIEVLNRQLKECIKGNRESLLQSTSALTEAHVSHATMLSYKLKETQKETMLALTYSNETELIEAQTLLLDLGEFLLQNADLVVYEVRSLYYTCLIHLLKRGELDLGHLALDRVTGTKIHERKSAVGLRYRTFLKNLLARALEKLNGKGTEGKVREFVEFICSLCYFRMVSFREKLLASLKQKSFVPIPEWRGTTFDLEEEVRINPNSLPMFDWERYFYRYLPTESQVSLLDSSSWQGRMSKRGLAFFRFLSEWTLTVTRYFLQKHVPWPEIPGYNVLIKAFLLELKDREITQYPEALVKASISLLSNPHLISIFILIVYQKTNVFAFETVKETMIMTENWLLNMYEAGFVLPLTFPDAFFVEAMRIVLRSDIAMNVANAIRLLYRVYQILHAEIKEKLVLEVLLGAEAYGFIFHWSAIVRFLFWTFLLYRITSLKVIPLTPLTPIDLRIIKQADDLSNLIQNPFSESFIIDLGPEKTPYIGTSRTEYTAVRQSYETWLESKMPEYQKETVGKYGFFAQFPYPEMKAELAVEDKVERRLEEEW